MKFSNIQKSVILSILVVWAFSFSTAVSANEWKRSGVLQFGLDAWHLDPSVKQDNFYGPFPQDYDLSHTMLAMPSSRTMWQYRPVSPWYKFQGSISPTRSLVFSTKFRADQSIGFRLDELSVDYSLSEFIGARAGVVDYKLSWCSAYDVASPWIFEPNSFCSMQYTTTVTGGAPGFQTYLNNKYGSYRLQTIGGLYFPGLANYDTEDFGNFSLDGSAQKNNKHLKYGLSLNLLNVDTGTTARFSWIQTKQQARSDLLSVGDQISNMTYAALNFNLTPRVSVKLTRSDFFGSIMLDDQFPAEFSWNGATQKTHFSNTTAEMRYSVNPRNTLAVAYSLYQYGINNFDIPSPLFDSYNISDGKFFMLDRQQISTSWRYDWDSGVFAIVQLSYTNLINGYNDGRYRSNAMAAGLRLGFVY
jgi:hypothetical protein